MQQLGMTELFWNARRYHKHQGMPLMERPWYIMSPDHRDMIIWQYVSIVAVLFVSTYTPYEVSL